MADNAPVGTIIAWPSTSIPTNWWSCDGTSKVKADFLALWNVIGYTWGGSGLNYTIPDFRDRALYHVGTNVLFATAFGEYNHHHHGPSHTHTVTGQTADSGTHLDHTVTGQTTDEGSHTHTTNTAGMAAGSDATAVVTVNADGTHHHHADFASVGEGGNHYHAAGSLATASGGTDATDNVNPPGIGVKWIIKYQLA